MEKCRITISTIELFWEPISDVTFNLDIVGMHWIFSTGAKSAKIALSYQAIRARYLIPIPHDNRIFLKKQYNPRNIITGCFFKSLLFCF